MNIQLIIAAVIASASFGGAWKVQDWRYTAKEAERAQQELSNQRLQAATAIRRIDNVSAAQSAAATRELRLRADVDGARTAHDRLRDAADSTLRAAAASHEACLVNSAQLADVFKSCSSRYGEVARDADLWESGAKTLEDAWPK